MELLQTLQHLKKSAGKLQKETPAPDRQDMINALTVPSFNTEFEACLKELKTQRTEEAKKGYILPKKRETPRTVDIIDKISIDDVLRQYKHDFASFFDHKEK